MALQGAELVILGLGIVKDTPPNSLQPPLADGIHLRWAFEPRRGFPTHGFYLLRRPHKEKEAVPRCLDKLTRNLKAPSSVGDELDITAFGRVSSDSSINLTESFPPTASAEFDLRGREYLRFDFSQENLARRIEVRLGFTKDAEIRVTALSGDAACAVATVHGQAGDIKTAWLESDAISAVELGGGAAALIDLCFVPVSERATIGWEPVPDFPYPLTLPLTHPDYPASSALGEDLAAARALARARIVYGDPDQLTAAPAAMASDGAVLVSNGSPIVRGSGTSWGDELVGAVLQVAGDPTGYTVAAVIDPEKLALSRPYNGGPSGWFGYAVYRDAFGQLHDYLAHLVAGGSAAGPMMNRSLPSRLVVGGAVNLSVGSAEVTGIATSWGAELDGLSLQVVRESGGSVDVEHGSALVRGVGTAWGVELKGHALQVEGERGDYHIIGVEPFWQLLVLERSYAGSTGGGRAYTINERTAYTIARVESPTSLRLDRAYHANAAPETRYTLSYTIQARPRSSDSDDEAPTMPRQYPLDFVLLAALHPAAAQALGLYWVDRYARPGEAYDYLILADHDGRFRADPWETVRQVAAVGFTDVDGYITFNRRAEPAQTLDPPADVRVFALPSFSARARSDSKDSDPDAQHIVGLRWETGAGGPLVLPSHAVMYHVWRASLGNDETPSTKESYQPITDGRPVLGAAATTTHGPGHEPLADWPPFPLHFIDSRLHEGWYGYQVSGIDIFGRHSFNSAPAVWHQWTPAPALRPWYYDDARGDAAVHTSAVRLLDKSGPPPPTGVEAFALDPTDPHVLQDEAYRVWRASHPGVVGLRVRWLWTHAHADEAPDASEFRIYYQPGRMNAWAGNTLRVSPLSHAESLVETDIDNTRPDAADAYAGAQLRCGADTFRVLGNEAGSPLRLRIAHVGPFYLLGTIELRRDSSVVTGSGTNWGPELAGLTLRPDGDAESYNILRVDTPTRLILKRAYARTSGAGRSYAIIGLLPPARAACTLALPPPRTDGALMTAVTHPLHVDYSAPASWQRRIHVVGYEEHVNEVTDAAVTGGGPPVRRYDVFLPAPDSNEGQPFAPSLSDPLVYAHVGVSAADNKTHTADDPRRDGGDRGGRPGNEGRLGPQATIFRVRRERPPAPVAPPDAGRAFAAAADYHGRSVYTYRWRPAAHLKTHIFRALDDSVFQTDWEQRQPPGPLRPSLSPSDLEHFPAEWHTSDDSAVQRRRNVAEALNRLNEFARDEAGRGQAMNYYRDLTDDALRVLAGLPGNEAAFTQLTIQPLDPEDPSTFDRTSPDDPDTHTPDPSLRAYRDTLDGRAANCYFYRASYLDGAHTRGALSLSGPPVYVPNVVPPRAPSTSRGTGGDGRVSLCWVANREHNLALYRVYRSADFASSSDVRRMTEVARVALSPTAAPAAGVTLPAAVTGQPTWLEYADPAPPGTWFYRIVAEDVEGNRSRPSELLRVTSFVAPPVAPTWEPPVRRANVVALAWRHADPQLSCLVERRAPAESLWLNVSGWLPRGVYTHDDQPPDLAAAWVYRLRVRDAQGQTASTLPVVVLDAEVTT